MLTRIITLVFRRRHYWRSVSFDDIAELYVSRLIMVFAINIVNLFAAIYLYRLGYSIVLIAGFYAALYLMKVPLAIPFAKYAAYFGPKQGILTANILRIPAMIAVAMVPEYGIPALIAFGVLQQFSSALYDMCYMISFSKAKHAVHAGKEIGTMAIIEKVAKMLSPLVGGIIATILGPHTLIIIACVLFILAALPLFHTVESMPTRLKLKLSGFPWRLSRATVFSESVVGFDFVASGMTWTLFVAIFVFGGIGENVYSALGALASLGVFVSAIAAWTFGKLIDRRKGHVLLVAGTVINSILHLFRPFVSTPAGVIGVNLVNETATSAYAMPFTRAVFDVADNTGSRIAYVMLIEMALNLGAAFGCMILAIGVWSLGESSGMMLVFIVASVYQLCMLTSTRQAK